MGRPMANLEQRELNTDQVVQILKPAATGEWDHEARTSFAPGQGQSLKHNGVSLAMEWDLSEQWMLKSISSMRSRISEYSVSAARMHGRDCGRSIGMPSSACR